MLILKTIYTYDISSMSSVGHSHDCCQNLLRLVSRGSAIIAELLRLSEMIPTVFTLESRIDSSKYAGIIYDFSFFKIHDFEAEFNQKLDSTPGLQERDEEFKENFLDILTRFYLAFDSVHKYAYDLRHFIEDIEEGLYIQATMESLLLDSDSRQLLSEGLFLLGVMLLVVDDKIDGSVRERMLVSYYRYSAERSSPDSNVDDVCNLMRNTGYSPSVTTGDSSSSTTMTGTSGGKRPVNYPEEYFRRAKIDPRFASMIIGRLRSDDVYNQLTAYPFPEHRSVALATQASMLYVCLYFCPDILNNQASVMREVVDRFFPDNWVISIHMGMVINLQDAWEPYRAARTALANTIDVVNVKHQVKRHEEHLLKVLPELEQLLKEGVLTEEMVLHKMSNILNRIRDSNVTLRWLMLHCPPPAAKIDVYPSKKSHMVKDVLMKDSTCGPLDAFRLLLITAQLESKCKEIYQKLLHDKESKWESFRKESHDRILELVDVFSGTKPLTRVAKNTGIQDQFCKIASELESLSFGSTVNTLLTSKKIVRLVSSLEELQDLHQLDSNLQVKQYVIEVRKLLHSMLRTMGIKEDVLITMQIVGDLTFAWRVIDNYTEYMQKGIKEDPSLVGRLRATFIKLSSALDLPLLRINQSDSPDLVSVSQYYSTELVTYVRKVLHIIPETLFSLMARIIDIQTNHIQELPTRLMKDQMKHYAQLDQRHEVAKLTYSISLFAEGMLMMKTTLVGIIELDPKKLLEDGIRKELVLQVASALHVTLVFPVMKNKTHDVAQRLQNLAQIMDGYKRSFEYVQDYIGIYGLKIWQEEVSRIVNFNIEQECNAFIRRKVLDFDSVYQSRNIPIPKFPPLDQFSVTFIGRLTRELLRITDPKQTIFVNQMRSWYDCKTRAEVVTPRLFTLMMQSIGTAGMNGVDRLISFMIQTELKHVRKFIERNILRDKITFDQLELIAIQLDESDSQPPTPVCKLFTPITEKANRLWSTVNDALIRVGQMQLTKMSISHELHVSSRFQSRQLVSCLQSLNDAVINELSKKERIGNIPEDSPLLYELTNFLEWNGITDPLSKVYLSDKAVTFLDIVLVPIVVTQVSRFMYTPSIHSLTAKRAVDVCDGTPYIVGLVTLLRQFKDEVSHKFMDRISGYAKSLIESVVTDALPQDAVNTVLLLQELCRWAKWPMLASLPTLSPQNVF